MSERESMKLRELKEAAYALYQRGRYAQCAEKYAHLARLLPRDPNVRVRLAEAFRRAGQKEQAIAAYRKASQMLLSLGCESRARGALKAALDLDPRDLTLQQEMVRLGQGAATPTELEDEELYRFDRLPPPTPPPARMRSVPPPSITPVSVRGSPGAMPRPAAPARDSATQTMSHSMAQVAGAPRAPEAAPLPKVIVSMSAFGDPPAPGSAQAAGRNTPPSITPITVGRSVPQKPLPGVPLGLPAPPRSPPGVSPSTVNPAPTPERPTVKVLTLMNRTPALTAPPTAVMPYKPEMRRLAPNVVALRVSPQARWVIIRSESDLEVSRSEELPNEFSAAH